MRVRKFIVWQTLNCLGFATWFGSTSQGVCDVTMETKLTKSLCCKRYEDFPEMR